MMMIERGDKKLTTTSGNNNKILYNMMMKRLASESEIGTQIGPTFR